MSCSNCICGRDFVREFVAMYPNYEMCHGDVPCDYCYGNDGCGHVVDPGQPSSLYTPLSAIISSQRSSSPSRVHLLTPRFMRGQSRSSRFRVPFQSALQDYERATNISLDKHPLADQLNNCNSVESITSFLQDQTQAWGDFRGSDRLVKSIKNTVPILCMLSGTTALGDAVCLSVPIGGSKSDAYSIVISACENNTYRPRHLTCRMYPSLVPYVRIFLTKPTRRPRRRMTAMMISSTCSNR